MVWWMWLAGGLVLLVFELVTPSGFPSASEGISDYIFAIVQLAQTTLRSEVEKIWP